MTEEISTQQDEGIKLDMREQIIRLLGSAHSLACQAHTWQITTFGLSPTTEIINKAADGLYDAICHLRSNA